MAGPPTIQAPTGPPKQSEPAKSKANARSEYKVSSGVTRKACRISIYGPGGIGKTTLAHLIGTKVANPLIIDLDQGSLDLDCERLDGVNDFESLRRAINDKDLWKGREALILDNATIAEEFVCKWVIGNVPPKTQGTPIDSIDDYGYGRGFAHVYRQFLLLLGDLDRHFETGRNVVVIAHDCVSDVLNPYGEQWIRYEPRLQTSKKGEKSIRLRLKEWSDHLVYLGYDVSVSKDGIASGGGSRMIYTSELPSRMAKSRTLPKEIKFASAVDASLWNELLGEK